MTKQDERKGKSFLMWVVIMIIICVVVLSCSPLRYSEATLVKRRILVNDVSTYIFRTDSNELIFKRSFNRNLYQPGRRYTVSYRKKYTFEK